MKRKFKVLITTVAAAAVLGAGVITAGVLMNTYSGIMNGLLGSGDMIVNKREGSENWTGDYIDFDSKNANESWDNASKVNKEIAGEGITLLKNENVLPLASGTKVTVLGRNCGHHVTAPTDDVSTISGSILIPDALKSEGFDVNQSAWNYYKTFSQVNDGSGEINPSDADYQTNVASTYGTYGTGTALIVLRRSYAEGSDPSTNMGSGENNRTALSLSANELDLISEACSHFSSVVMAISSPNAMELGFLKDGSNYTDPYTKKTYDFSNVKGALWIGGLGVTGAESFAKIISGEINPSGHLVDTYVRNNLTDIPSSVNYGEFKYTNVETAEGEFYARNNYDVEYEEGIYVGYRYFETAAYEAKRNNYAGFDYDKSVIYPFGYGLSYTSYEYSYAADPTYDKDSETYTFKVNVKNTGAKDGKTAVQIYVNAPYTTGGIEKAQVTLAGFTKTDTIKAGNTATVEVKVEKDYMTSYDYKDNKCYVLDEGDYKFYLGSDKLGAHSWSDDSTGVKTVHINKTVYSGDNKRVSDKVTAENLFDRDLNWKFKEYTENQAGSGYATNLTRANFKDSYPTAPTGNDLVANDYLLECFRVYDPSKDYSSSTNSPYKDVEKITETQTLNQNRGILQLADMRGVDFDDSSWTTFIDQFTLDDLQTAYTVGGWADKAITELGVPATSGADSPSGITSFRLSNTKCFYPYCAEVLLTATWNVELARKYGDSLGEEAAAQRERTGGQAVNYLFGAGADTHRTPFGGRNQEYYSEDPYIAGKMLAAEASGAGEKGLTMLVKHCALNEQETVRQGNSTDGNGTTYTSFVNEQALREIYMKPWEIYAKEATRNVKYYDDAGNLVSKKMTAASAIMTSYNRVGGVWSGASPIISGILRKECGFTGTAFTDAGGTVDGYMNTDYGLVTEGTTSCLMDRAGSFKDGTSNTAIYHLKNAAHYKMFNIANGNAMLGLTPGSYITYTTAPWQYGLIAAYIACGVIVAGLAALDVFFFISPKGNVEKQPSANKDDDE